MKKVIIFLFIVTIVLAIKNSSNADKILIPTDAIRFRIIANSNTIEDQETKMQIKTDLEPIIENILDESNNIEDTRLLINKNTNNIEEIIKKRTTNYQLNYGNNYFPEKTYKNVVYKEGNYESLVITLGAGLGENWWCVLFPPLCLLEAQEEETESINYSFYIKDILDKYL